MNIYVLLFIAIALEVVGTMLLPASQNFTKIAPTSALIIAYGLSFYFHYASSIILSPVIGYIALRTLKTKDLLKSIISGVIIIAPITLNILIHSVLTLDKRQHSL